MHQKDLPTHGSTYQDLTVFIYDKTPFSSRNFVDESVMIFGHLPPFLLPILALYVTLLRCLLQAVIFPCVFFAFSVRLHALTHMFRD